MQKNLYVYVMRVYDVLVERRHVVLNFEDEKLKNISGEVIPKKDEVDEVKCPSNKDSIKQHPVNN